MEFSGITSYWRLSYIITHEKFLRRHITITRSLQLTLHLPFHQLPPMWLNHTQSIHSNRFTTVYSIVLHRPLASKDAVPPSWSFYLLSKLLTPLAVKKIISITSPLQTTIRLQTHPFTNLPPTNLTTLIDLHFPHSALPFNIPDTSTSISLKATNTITSPVLWDLHLLVIQHFTFRLLSHEHIHLLLFYILTELLSLYTLLSFLNTVSTLLSHLPVITTSTWHQDLYLPLTHCNLNIGRDPTTSQRPGSHDVPFSDSIFYLK